jgi:hypothetical protein
MKFSIKIISALLLFSVVVTSCEDEVVTLPVPDCVTLVTYRGTNVCSNEATAAAVELADSSFLIISNFFDFADSTTISDNQELSIDYTEVDSTLFNSGALCGVAIVAPVTEITCFELN